MIRKFIRKVLIAGFLLGFLAVCAAGFVAVHFYFRLTRDLPKIERLSDYRPKAVSSIYAADGTLLAEVFEERRYPIKFDAIPLLVKNAFLAAEDANFYSHPGVDLVSIARAVYVNLVKKAAKQGASTITQQVVKSLLLSREKTYERKIKEAILSYRLEKGLTKDEIFSIYLNEIFLGNHSYGIQAASRVHFRKELTELTIGEAAFLAGLPQRPSELINPNNRPDALRRQRYVIGQMLKNKMITVAEAEGARNEKLTIYPVNNQTLYRAPYYVTHAETVADEALRGIDKRFSLKNPGGYRVHTAANLRATDIAERAVRRGLREVDKRRGWRGPLAAKAALEASDPSGAYVATKFGVRPGEVYKAQITAINQKTGVADVRVGEFEGTVPLQEAAWAKRLLQPSDEVIGTEPAKALKVGQVIEVSLPEDVTQPVTDPTKKLRLQLDQTPEVESAFAVLNVWTGEVIAIIGGYQHTESVFNRATQGHLQPGSAFKPFIYTAALDVLHYKPNTIVNDSPISLVAGNGQLWSPRNFDNKYLGPMTLRRALERSRNVVSVFLLTKIGVERGVQSARSLGITTPIEKNLSISLGTPEVIPLEMVRAYGTFAAGGRLADSVVVNKIEDRDGKVIFQKHPSYQQVLSEETAFLMANMMKGVVERGTATLLRKLEKPVAGKTGTTNNHMDAWFIGYTPDWAAGTWVGFDRKRPLGKIETGGKAAAPIFLYFMQEFLADVPGIDFNIPDGVTPVAIDLSSGRPVDPSAPGAFIEYFKTGTEPTPADFPVDELPPANGGATTTGAQDYLTSDEF